MEFKGTKGKWNYEKGTYLENTFFFSFNNDEATEETKANALLISKAPEMLEKLAEVKDLLEAYPSEAEMNLKAVEIRQLIKEATEL